MSYSIYDAQHDRLADKKETDTPRVHRSMDRDALRRRRRAGNVTMSLLGIAMLASAAFPSLITV